MEAKNKNKEKITPKEVERLMREKANKLAQGTKIYK